MAVPKTKLASQKGRMDWWNLRDMYRVEHEGANEQKSTDREGSFKGSRQRLLKTTFV